MRPIWSHPVITQASFNAAKAKWLMPNDFTLLVLGDSTKIKSTLEKAIGPVSDVQVLPPDSDWNDVSKAVLGH
ncbi:MAG: hypothetical protein ACOYOK_00275 [Pseudobdellovibrionaceae bacterium]